MSFQAPSGARESRGVVSFYATHALESAGSLESWVQGTLALVEKDLQAGLLRKLQAPALQVLGDPAAPAPGRPAGR